MVLWYIVLAQNVLGDAFMSIRHFSLRIDGDLLDRLHFIASYEGRSVNSEVIVLIRDAIEKYEEKHGKIESVPPKKRK